MVSGWNTYKSKIAIIFTIKKTFLSTLKGLCIFETGSHYMISHLSQDQEQIIRDILKNSQSPYAMNLEKVLDWINGDLYAITPSNVSEQQIKNFNSGGLTTKSASKSPIEDLQKFITRNRTGYLIVEDPASPKTDSFRYDVNSLYPLHFRNESYAFAFIEDIKEDVLFKILIAVGSWNLWGFVVDKIDLQSITTSEELNTALKPDKIDTVFAEVYDGEGFILWQRIRH